MEFTTIKALFGRRNIRFVIPAYQRAYAWENKQFSQFIEDLQECTDCEYYLGHFLFEQDEDTLYVIDGQQRLTTCVIFFSAFVNVVRCRKKEWVDNDNKEQIQDLLLDLSDYYLKEIRHQKQKFITVDYDNNFFIDAIIEHNNVANDDLTSKSKIAIIRALKFFEDKLRELSIDEMLSYASTLENASITTFVVKDKLQACQIFAYQNDRGKRLSNLEILKAYFMLQIYRTPVSTEEQHKSNIVYIEKAFEEIYRYIVLVTVDEDSALNYYWRAIGPQGYYSEKVVSEVKIWLNSFPKDEQVIRIRRFVTELSKAFHLIYQIEQDNSFYASNLKNLRNMAISYPILIRAKLSNVDKDVFQRLIKLMENITFRSLIRGGRADIISRLQNVFAKATDSVSFNYMIDSVIWKLKHDCWWGYWNDSQLYNHLSSGWFYGNRVDNYVLWRYEQYLCNKDYPIPKVIYSEVISNESIEHIAPQTQSAPTENGYGVYENEESPKDGIVSGEWMNSIGNLMLMSKSQNSSLGNRPFSKKLKVYGSDNLLNQQKEIVEFVSDEENPVWDKTCIEKRYRKIIQAAKEIWSLDNI